ncbi:MAG TPA: hypothetical protein VFW90_00950 [Candidatus Saccharimonadales bacterium]|nr:hypothetical protein [Candidatus Saccharimonadales bacterium]
MTRNLKFFIGLIVVSTVAFLALGDGLSHSSETVQNIASIPMILLFFYIVFNFVYRVIYRLVGVTDKLMFRGRKYGWPRLTHQQAEEVNKYWIIWLGGSLLTYVVYTLLFHRSQWKSAIITGLVAFMVVTLAKLNSRTKIAGHTKEEVFK